VSEWRPLLILLGGFALALFVLSATVKRSRRVAMLLASAMVAAAFAARHYEMARAQRGILTLPAAVEARLAPSAASRVLAALPEGATTRVLERTERWLRVEHDGASGWIPAASAVAPHTP